jgi:hypothetical protein
VRQKSMRTEQPVYTCDSPDCKSICTLEIGDQNPNKSLVLRGWRVDGEKTYCPIRKNVEVVKPE